jgi:hypothetical protein
MSIHLFLLFHLSFFCSQCKSPLALHACLCEACATVIALAHAVGEARSLSLLSFARCARARFLLHAIYFPHLLSWQVTIPLSFACPLRCSPAFFACHDSSPTFCLDTKGGAKKSRQNECLRPFCWLTPLFNSSVCINTNILLATVKDETVASCYCKTPKALYCVLPSLSPQQFLHQDAIRRWNTPLIPFFIRHRDEGVV